MTLRRWRFKCSLWSTARVLLKTRVARTSSCLMEKPRYPLSIVVSQIFSCLSVGFDGFPCVLLHCIMSGCSGQELRHIGCCFIFFRHLNKQSVNVEYSLTSSDSVSFCLKSLCCFGSPISSIYSIITPLPLLFLSALLSERTPRGASVRGAPFLRGGGTLSAFPADHSYPQCAR